MRQIMTGILTTALNSPKSPRQLSLVKKGYTLLFVFFCLCGFSDNYELSACCMFKNNPQYEREWKDMEEWLEYHRVLGVEHFFIYADRCTEDFIKNFDWYVDKGIVTIIKVRNKSWDHSSFQAQCLNNFLSSFGHLTNWCLMTDPDEFIVTKAHNNIKAMLDSLDENVGQILLQWVVFGSSGYENLPLDELLTERFIFCGDNDWVVYKGICKPKLVSNHNSLHSACLKPGAKTIIAPLDFAQINHYWTKDESYFRMKMKRRNALKMTRGHVSELEISELLKRFNRNEDYSIFNFIPALKEALYLKHQAVLTEYQEVGF